MTDEDSRPYAGQEGEINDKLLLDAAWERQQKKVSSTVDGLVVGTHGCTQTNDANLCVRQRVPRCHASAREHLLLRACARHAPPPPRVTTGTIPFSPPHCTC